MGPPYPTSFAILAFTKAANRTGWLRATPAWLRLKLSPPRLKAKLSARLRVRHSARLGGGSRLGPGEALGSAWGEALGSAQGEALGSAQGEALGSARGRLSARPGGGSRLGPGEGSARGRLSARPEVKFSGGVVRRRRQSCRTARLMSWCGRWDGGDVATVRQPGSPPYASLVQPGRGRIYRPPPRPPAFSHRRGLGHGRPTPACPTLLRRDWETEHPLPADSQPPLGAGGLSLHVFMTLPYGVPSMFRTQSDIFANVSGTVCQTRSVCSEQTQLSVQNAAVKYLHWHSSYVSSRLIFVIIRHVKGTNPSLKKSLNIPEIYAKMFGRFHWLRL